MSPRPNQAPVPPAETAAVWALLGLAEPAAWMAAARCAQTDPEVFFPKKGRPDSTSWAKRICRRCPVRQACLAHALEHRENDGVWGGLSPRERRALLRAERQDDLAARRHAEAEPGVAP